MSKFSTFPINPVTEFQPIIYTHSKLTPTPVEFEVRLGSWFFPPICFKSTTISSLFQLLYLSHCSNHWFIADNHIDLLLDISLKY